MKLGIFIFGLATVAAGIFDLIWREFERAHQPIQAWGDNIAGERAMAYVAAVWLITGGALILWRRTERAGALACGAIYFVFAVFWLPRFMTAPRVLGYHAAVYLGVLGGPATQLIVVAAAALVYAYHGGRSASANRLTAIARWVFGLSAIIFGIDHLTAVQATGRMVPQWMPLGSAFWVVFTGTAFILAGVAILARILDVLAARLLALMLLLFSAVALVPNIVRFPHYHIPWGANAYNLAAVGAIWIFANAIDWRPRETT